MKKTQRQIEGNSMDKEKRLVDIEEAARLLCLSPDTLRTRVAPKAKHPLPLKARRIGRSVRFYLPDVIRYMESL